MMITEVETISPGSLRAVFSFGQPRQVQIELDIHLTGGQDVAESHWAEIARIIDAYSYHQRLDPDCRECDWYQVLNLIRRCHEAARFASCHLSTSIRIEDGGGAYREFQSKSRNEPLSRRHCQNGKRGRSFKPFGHTR
jgi:uncharacterized protein YqgV (UPF0045/DUF77 family)